MVHVTRTSKVSRLKIESKRFNFSEWLRLIWFSIDALTHLTIEFAYVWLALTTTAAKTDSYYGFIWREYARADARWAVSDKNVISIEIATVFVGFLCLFAIYGTYYRKAWAHPLQLLICVAELYGGWMTFAPEWLDGSPNLDGSDVILLWIYLFFMNILWVIVPLILLYESFVHLTKAADKTSPETTSPSSSVWTFMMILMVVYNILVPVILLQADGVPVQKDIIVEE